MLHEKGPRKSSPSPSRYDSLLSNPSLLRLDGELRHAVDAEPGCGGLEGGIHVFDVGDAVGFQPLPECPCALLGVNGNTVLPGRTSTQHAVELDARFGSELQVLDELGIADTSRQVDERLAGCPRGRAGGRQ